MQLLRHIAGIAVRSGDTGNVVLENNELVSKKINIPNIAKIFLYFVLQCLIYNTAFLYDCQHEL